MNFFSSFDRLEKPNGSIPASLILIFLCHAFYLAPVLSQVSSQFFEIIVVDQQTDRGVPMVTLTLVDGTEFHTDSAGRIAFFEPELMGKNTFFHVESHGYSFPLDGLGQQGFVTKVTPGKSVTIKVKRKNIAQRLYRITGRGVYRDSVLLGKPVPFANPKLAGDVVGQDTVQMKEFDGKLYWFWGDTNRPQYPLGQFKTSGAVSSKSAKNDLDAETGIQLKYFCDAEGFSRQMTPVPGKGAVWLHGLTVLQDSEGQDQMLGHYVRLEDLDKRLEHGILKFNRETQTFEKWKEFDLSAKLFPQGVSMWNENGNSDYVYFCRPFPFIRVPAKVSDFGNQKSYQAFTCLKPGSRYQKNVNSVHRNAHGEIIWAWKANTDFIDAQRSYEMTKRGFLKKSETKFVLKDPNQNIPIYLKGGSVHWNNYRKKWILIGLQIGGTSSYFGEVWYAEANRLEGPWENVRHILTHNQYSFYNPSHHPKFDKKNGQVIFFEGTFSTTFSKAKRKMPRYDYNQILYKLDLGSPRMNLPKMP